MGSEITFKLQGYSKNEANLDKLQKLVEANCIEVGESFIEKLDETHDLFCLNITGSVENTCWNLTDKPLNEFCKKLGVGLEIYGSVERFFEIDEEIDEDDKEELEQYDKEEDETGVRYFIYSQHIFIWSNGDIEEDEDKWGKLDGLYDWSTDEEWIEHFNPEE